MKPLFLFFLFVAPAVFADNHAEVSPGQQLHQNNCTRCHDAQVYTRNNRKVTDYAALKNRVTQCDSNLGLGLFPEDVQAITDHLNQLHYHFTP